MHSRELYWNTSGDFSLKPIYSLLKCQVLHVNDRKSNLFLLNYNI